MTTGRPQWVVAAHDMAHIGDHVILSKPADTPGVIIGVDPHTGVPTVQITDGPRSGQTIGVWPSQIASITKRA